MRAIDWIEILEAVCESYEGRLEDSPTLHTYAFSGGSPNEMPCARRAAETGDISSRLRETEWESAIKRELPYANRENLVEREIFCTEEMSFIERELSREAETEWGRRSREVIFESANRGADTWGFEKIFGVLPRGRLTYEEDPQEGGVAIPLSERLERALLKKEESESGIFKTRTRESPTDAEEMRKIAREYRRELTEVKSGASSERTAAKIELVARETAQKPIDYDAVTEALTERIIAEMIKSPDGIYC